MISIVLRSTSLIGVVDYLSQVFEIQTLRPGEEITGTPDFLLVLADNDEPGEIKTIITPLSSQFMSDHIRRAADESGIKTEVKILNMTELQKVTPSARICYQGESAEKLLGGYIIKLIKYTLC